MNATKPLEPWRLRDTQPQECLVLSEVAKAFGFSHEQMLSSSRQAPLAWARQVAMALVQELCGLTLAEVGRLFNRHLSTVAWAKVRVQESCEVSPDLDAQVTYLKQSIKTRYDVL